MQFRLKQGGTTIRGVAFGMPGRVEELMSAGGTICAVTWKLVIAALLASATASADCPTSPDDPVCRPWTAILLPTIYATYYAPNDASGPWFGGGLEITAAWSDNTPAFGPSQGKIRFDVGALRSSTMGTSTMAMYRGGAEVSLERNASRPWLVPHRQPSLVARQGRVIERRSHLATPQGDLLR